MKHTLYLLALAVLLGACGQKTTQNKTEDKTEEAGAQIISASIEELLNEPDAYLNKEVAIEGMVTHVCKHGGQKCFVVGEDGETQIRLVPSGDIDEFKIELEGSTLAFKGTFRVLNEEASKAHLEEHESHEHHATEMAHSKAEKADYYIETVSMKEL
ncbi:MAG: hypothetical protein CSA96_04475 [Bacteroidetes bacterium]|nr:MAG: hypothetical protein CSA96_04475 [Bacteroidota bacterium]